MDKQRLSGVFAAALTPMKEDYSPDLDSLPGYLDFLASRGCHGALLLGTTGEGPSFDPGERRAIFKAAREVRQTKPEFRLLAGTGTPSLTETIELTRDAFEAGFDGVVVLPPYYYRTASEEGLFAWYSLIINAGVPTGGRLFGYHIPKMSGVPLSINLLSRLMDAFPEKFAGLKDSSGDAEFTRQLGTSFGTDLTTLTGNDRLFSLALESSASGCITAAANLFSPLLREVWEAYKNGEHGTAAQNRLNEARDILERYPPAAPSLKAILALRHPFPRWSVRPPLMPISRDVEESFSGDLRAANF